MFSFAAAAILAVLAAGSIDSKTSSSSSSNSDSATKEQAAKELKSEAVTNLPKGNRIGLNNFEKDLEAINVFYSESNRIAESNPTDAGAGRRYISEISRKMDAVDVQQIPAELRDAWSEYRITIRNFWDYTRSIEPKKIAAIGIGTAEWQAAIDEVLATTVKLQAKHTVARTTLNSVGKDFGINLKMPDLLSVNK